MKVIWVSQFLTGWVIQWVCNWGSFGRYRLCRPSVRFGHCKQPKHIARPGDPFFTEQYVVVFPMAGKGPAPTGSNIWALFYAMPAMLWSVGAGVPSKDMAKPLPPKTSSLDLTLESGASHSLWPDSISWKRFVNRESDWAVNWWFISKSQSKILSMLPQASSGSAYRSPTPTPPFLAAARNDIGQMLGKTSETSIGCYMLAYCFLATKNPKDGSALPSFLPPCLVFRKYIYANYDSSLCASQSPNHPTYQTWIRLNWGIFQKPN